jgi:two-component system, NarL family, nitrate/nitrite response regulator NarL
VTRRGRSLLIATSDQLFAEAASWYLARRSRWSVRTAADALEALGAVSKSRPDAVLVLPPLSRLPHGAFATQVRRRWPGIVVVVVGGRTREGGVPADAAFDDIAAALAGGAGAERASGLGANRALPTLATLTPRQRHVLSLLALGLEPRQIAARMGVSPNTVRTHMQRLYRRLGAHRRLDVLRIAARHGLIDPDEGARGAPA